MELETDVDGTGDKRGRQWEGCSRSGEHCGDGGGRYGRTSENDFRELPRNLGRQGDAGTRHSDRDLIEIKLALTEHPGPTPVLLHFQNSAGRRITIAAGESFNVKRTEDLEEALGRWLED